MNTEIFAEAKVRAMERKVRNVLVATNTGKSVEAAQEIMGTGFNYFAVGNPSTSRDLGWVLHCGISQETKDRLEGRGIVVIERELSIFQHSSSVQVSHVSLRNANAAYVRRFNKTFDQNETVPNNVCKVIRQILGEFFGDGLCVCIEITLMAADSGKLPLEEDCMAIATPRGYSHAAIVIHPVKTLELFGTHFRVKDLILVPSEDDVWFNDGPIP
jgi:hypothetical protein